MARRGWIFFNDVVVLDFITRFLIRPYYLVPDGKLATTHMR